MATWLPDTVPPSRLIWAISLSRKNGVSISIRIAKWYCTANDVIMKRLLPILLVAVPLFAQKSPPPEATKKIQVLIITGRDDHDWRGVTPLMRQYLDNAGIFETRIAEEFRDAGPEALKLYDVAVLVYSDKAGTDHWTAGTKQLLLDFVK